MRSPNPNKNIFVTCTFDILTECIEGNSLDQKSPQEFIDEFILRQGSIEEIHHVYIHLYEESTEYPFFINFKESIIHDPMNSRISDILCAIIFKIANQDREDYFRELLRKIKFMSQNEPAYFNWGKKSTTKDTATKCPEYFINFDQCYVRLTPSTKIDLSDCYQPLIFKWDLFETFVNEMYQVLKGTALYKHP